MRTYVFIKAGEGNTTGILIHNGTKQSFREYAATSWTYPATGNDVDYLASERTALLEMLDAAPDSLGLHELPTVEPIWEQSTLVITDSSFAYVD